MSAQSPLRTSQTWADPVTMSTGDEVIESVDAQSDVIAGWRRPRLVEAVEAAARALTRAYANGASGICCGNAGSAADATHLSAEMLGPVRRDRRTVFSLSLAGNHSAITAIANGYGYEYTIARQVEAPADPGDIALDFSTSYQCANVSLALEAARGKGACTVALTGSEPGLVGEAAEISKIVPSRNTACAVGADVGRAYPLRPDRTGVGVRAPCRWRRPVLRSALRVSPYRLHFPPEGRA